jgi:pSer/pThr/pTyr-binding forkhead associated (FHA) protein
MLHLTVHHSALEGTEYWLTRPMITVGRTTVNDVIIDSLGVAPNHARLTLTEAGDAYRIEALESLLGTYVNGQRIRSAILEPGDRIRFGSIDAVLTDDPGPMPSATGEGDAVQKAILRIAELEAQLKSRENQLGDVSRELARRSGEVGQLQADLQQTRETLEKSQQDHARSELNWQNHCNALNAEVREVRQQREAAQAEAGDFKARFEDAERRLAELDDSARKRVQRGHDTISALRRKSAQQDSEIREARYEIMKLRQGKEAAETLLESVKRCYSRDKKHHSRLVEQFRERAREESLRAEHAMLQLAKLTEVVQSPSEGSRL